VRHIVETKVSHAELQTELMNMVGKFDDLNKDIAKRGNTFVTVKELNQVIQELDQKANAKEMNEALNSKASKDSVISALHRKANKGELEALINAKVDLHEFQDLARCVNNKADIEEMTKVYQMLETKVERSDFIALSNAVSNKAEIKDFEMIDQYIQEMKMEHSKKISDIDLDLDRLIENIKKEFQTVNLLITDLDVKKADFDEIGKLKTIMESRIDNEELNIALKEHKKDFSENFSEYKNDFTQSRKAFEDHINDKLLAFERGIEKLNDDHGRYKDKFTDLNDRRKLDMDEIMKQAKSLVNNFGKDLQTENNIIKMDMQKFKHDINELYERKAEKKDIDILRTKCFSDMDNKVRKAFTLGRNKGS
jgi:hypothetical protein